MPVLQKLAVKVVELAGEFLGLELQKLGGRQTAGEPSLYTRSMWKYNYERQLELCFFKYFSCLTLLNFEVRWAGYSF